MEKNKPMLVSISAVSGGGKTRIVEKLKETLTNAVSLHFDDYDFECPDEIVDWVQRGADYSEYKIEPFIDDLKKIMASNNNIQWILLDYPFSYVKNNLGQYIDYSIFLDTSLDVAMSRRLLRDHENACRDDIMNDLKFYLSHGRMCYLEMLKTVKPTCDLIVDGNQTENEVLQEILIALNMRFSKDIIYEK